MPRIRNQRRGDLRPPEIETMAGLSSVRLRLFAGDEGIPAGALDMFPAEAADRLFHREAFRKLSPKENLEPFSLAWFERIEGMRYSRQGHWLPRSLEFKRHRGDTVLGLGEGLGTDWLQFALNGADVIAASPSQEQLDLIRTHFELRGLTARCLHSPPHCLPLANDSIDVVCVQGLLHEVDDPSSVIDELYRVLRPGGKVIAVAPAKYNAGFWYDACYFWRKWLSRRRSIESPNAETARTLKKAFHRFVEHKISKRHLRRGEMPHLSRFLPLSVMERALGNLLVVKAFKPVSAAIVERRAA